VATTPWRRFVRQSQFRAKERLSVVRVSGTSPDLFIGQLRALRRDRRAYALI